MQSSKSYKLIRNQSTEKRVGALGVVSNTNIDSEELIGCSLKGADYFFAISDDLELFVGGGYLFNISKADITVEDENSGETAFDGATVRFGLQF